MRLVPPHLKYAALSHWRPYLRTVLTVGLVLVVIHVFVPTAYAQSVGERATSALTTAIFGYINALLATIIEFLKWVLGLEMYIVQWLLDQGSLILSDPILKKFWGDFRDFVNVFFIFGLLFIAVMNIVRVQVDNYAIKKALPKFILGVIGVNFSSLFVGLMLDAANILEAGIWGLADIGPRGGPPAGTSGACTILGGGSWPPVVAQFIQEGSMVCRLGAVSLFERIDTIEAAVSVDQTSVFIGQLVLGLVMLLLVFGLLALALIYLTRVIVLWVLYVSSPLFVASLVIPYTENIGSKWKDQFFKYAFMHVIVAFFVALGIKMMEAMIDPVAAGFEFGTTTLLEGSVASGVSVGKLSGLDFLRIIFMVAMIYLGVFTAAKSDHAPQLVTSIQNAGKKTLGWIGSRAKYLPTPFHVKELDPNTNKTIRRRVLVRDAAKAGKDWFAAIAKTADMRSDQIGARLAMNMGKLTYIPGKATIERQLESAHQSHEKSVADELRKGYVTFDIPKLYIALQSAKNNAERRAILDVLARDKGALDWRMITAALMKGDQHKWKEVTPDEVKEMRHRVSEALHDPDYAIEIEQANIGTIRNKESVGKVRAREHAADETAYMDQLVQSWQSGEAVIPADFEHALRYSLEDGKSDAKQILRLLGVGLSTGILTPERATEISQSLMNREPQIEYIGKLIAESRYEGKDPVKLTAKDDAEKELEWLGSFSADDLDFAKNPARAREFNNWLINKVDKSDAVQERKNKNAPNIAEADNDFVQFQALLHTHDQWIADAQKLSGGRDKFNMQKIGNIYSEAVNHLDAMVDDSADGIERFKELLDNIKQYDDIITKGKDEKGADYSIRDYTRVSVGEFQKNKPTGEAVPIAEYRDILLKLRETPTNIGQKIIRELTDARNLPANKGKTLGQVFNTTPTALTHGISV